MNPEDNNPLTNPGAPNIGTPTGLGGLDNASSPLTANPMGTMTGSVNMDAAGTNPNMGIENTIEEPLVPAAPVPGSIGSVTSVPPVDPASPTLGPVDQTQPAPVADATQAQPAPYNPFAQPAAPAGIDNPTPAPAVDLNGTSAPTVPTTPPPVQPTNAPKAQHTAKAGHMTIILAIIAALGIVAAIIFAVLFFNAKNNPKVVYVPSVADDTTNSAIEILTCSRENDFNYLIGYDHSVMGSQSVTLSYTGDKLSAITLDANATFDNESDANVAKDNYANAAVVRESIVADYQVEGNTMKASFAVANGNTLSDSDAASIVYGDGTDDADLSLSAVETHYESIGYTCSLE